MDAPDRLAPLRAFRDELYGCFGRRADALFEAADALLASAPPASLPHLSLSPLHRRGWGSVDGALAGGSLGADALRGALAARPARRSTSGRDADLADADLGGADLSDAELAGANPERARSLAGARFSGSRGFSTEQRDACADKWAVVDENADASPS